ncbi:MAG TPA: hypothetical protein ENN80_12625, partial [Candidatus Hydrogenedentes bacterium]|nr:hypothetical protein [Candidatus Hydrogenedentota bacterium]
MPVYKQTYRTYEGKTRTWFRWLTMVRYELRVVSRSWVFRILCGIGGLHAFVRFIQVMAFDSFTLKKRTYLEMLNSLPQGGLLWQQYTQEQIHKQLQFIDRYLEMFEVNGRMFFDFVRLQSPIVFLVIIMAGSGMICNDVRNNLTEVYFSKPLTWRD